MTHPHQSQQHGQHPAHPALHQLGSTAPQESAAVPETGMPTSDEARPTTHPTATPSTSTFPPVNAPSGSAPATKESPLSGAIPIPQKREHTVATPARRADEAGRVVRATAGRRVGSARRRRLGEELSERDRRVLTSLVDHRFLTTHQVTAFHFIDLDDHLDQADDRNLPLRPTRPDAADAEPRSGRPLDQPSITKPSDSPARVARRTLKRLKEQRLIVSVVPRRVGGIFGGATPNVWQLTSAGYRIATGSSRRHRPSEPSQRFLEHTLAIADAHLSVGAAAVRMQGRAAVQIETAATRRYPTPGGGLAQLTPDLAAVIQGQDAHGPFQDSWFIEVDCGTESIPTLLRKCEQYEAYRRSGTEEAITDGAFPLVLWVMAGRRGPARSLELQRRIAQHAHLEPAMFRFALPGTLTDVLASGGGAV